MTDSDRDPDAPLTLTHARLRAAHGDVGAARRILRAILADRPAEPEARRLLAALESGAPARGGTPGSMERRLPDGGALRDLLERIRRRRGPRRHAR